MIQRIQSLWLFLAAMVSGLLFLPSSVLYRYTVPGGLTGGQVKSLTATNFYPLLIVAAVMTLLPLATIFMFKNRKRQRGMVTMGILICIGFLSLMMMRIASINNGTPKPTDPQYGILGSLIPVAVIFLLILASRGIRSDVKLVESADRLR